MPSPQYNSIVFTQEDWRVLDVLETRNLAALKGITDDMSKDITRALSEGVTAGKGMPDLSKAISEATGMAKTRADRMARTETINACVDAARSRYQELGVKEFEFVAASDDRLCDICASFNGKIYKLTDDAHLPPIHPNCRCAIAPIIGDRKKEILAEQKARQDAEKKKETQTKKAPKKEPEKATEPKKYVSPITTAQDYNSLKTILQDRWNKNIEFSNNMEKIDFDASKEIILRTDYLIEDIPELKKEIQTIKAVTNKSAYMQAGPTKSGCMTFSFNTNKYSSENITHCKEQYAKEVEAHWSPKGTTYLDVGRHEAGHIMEWAIIKRKYATEYERATAWNTCEVAADIVEEAAQNVGKRRGMKGYISSKQMAREISNSALDSEPGSPWSEIMAEAFCDYYTNGEAACDISKEIVLLSKKYLMQYNK